ncbi:MAG: hypothetical protein AAGF32_04350 [Pseudomonadota bacterium]
MSRFAHADARFEIPETFPELAQTRVMVLEALEAPSDLIVHAFAAQDTRLVLQGAGPDLGAVGALVEECELAPGWARVFETKVDGFDPAQRLAEAALSAFGGLDTLICRYDLRASKVARTLHDGEDDIARLFETQVCIAEAVAGHMAQRMGGAILHLALVDDPTTSAGGASLAQASLGAIVSGQSQYWDDADVLIAGLTAYDIANDQVATDLAGAALVMASRRADWLAGQVMSVH